MLAKGQPKTTNSQPNTHLHEANKRPAKHALARKRPTNVMHASKWPSRHMLASKRPTTHILANKRPTTTFSAPQRVLVVRLWCASCGCVAIADLGRLPSSASGTGIGRSYSFRPSCIEVDGPCCRHSSKTLIPFYFILYSLWIYVLVSCAECSVRAGPWTPEHCKYFGELIANTVV